MISKNKIKYLRSLKLKKIRQKYDNFTVEGDKIALEILQTRNVEIETIIATEDWKNQHFNQSLRNQNEIEVATSTTTSVNTMTDAHMAR